MSQSQNTFDRTSWTLIFFGLFILGSLYHAIKWDTYFFEVIPLQVKFYSGRAQADDLLTFETICKVRKDSDCLVSIYRTQLQQDPNLNKECLKKLGLILAARNETREAASMFELYIKLGGKGPDTFLKLGQLYEKLGLLDKAAVNYKKTSKSPDEMVRIEGTQSYVKVLLKSERYREAEELIRSFRKMGKAYGLFMENELREVQRKIASISPGRSIQ